MEYSARLQAAVEQYVEEHLSCNLNEMSKFIYHHNPQFQQVQYPVFKNTVKTALKFMQFIENDENAKKSSKCDILPNMKHNSNDFEKSRQNAGKSPANSQKPKKRLKKKKNASLIQEFSDDCFVIDVEGSAADSQCNDDVSIVYSKAQDYQCNTPALLSQPCSNSTPALTSNVKKRLLQEDISERFNKKAMLSKMVAESMQDLDLSQLGGLEPIMESVFSVLMLLRLPQPQPVSLMISGPPGAGKTALASAMATAASLPVIQLRLCDIIATSSSLSPEKKIAEEFFNAVTGGPALVLISQLDQLSKDGGSQGPRNLDRGISRMLCTMIKNLTRESSEDPLLVVAECTHMELLDQRLLDAFSEQILIKPPTAHQRHAILKSIFATEKIDASVDLTYWGLKCSGFLAGDFVRLLNSARRTALKRSLKSSVSEALRRGKLPSYSIQPPPVVISAQDIIDALKHVKPVLKNEGFPSVPETTWQDVGGLSEVREELRRKMLDPIKEPDLLAKYNKTSSGILLWGPPGCGKTLLAKAVANEAGVNLLIVNGPDLLSMYQGESERAVRVVFARAASVAPCVIFFDEFDSLCPKRSKTGVESGSKSTIVNTLLTEMSGFLERSGVYVMAATNLPAVLDPAVLRPGRFDTLLYVGLPDIAGREAVLRAATKNGTLPALASDVNLRNIAERCDNFSGADCRHLVEMASTEAFEELKAWRKKQATHSMSNDVFTNNLIHSDQRQTEDKLLSGDQKLSNNEVKTTDDTCHMEEEEVDEVASHNSNDGSWASMEDEDANSCSNMNEPEVGSVAPSNILPEGVTSHVTEADKNDQTPVELNPFHEGPYVVYARHFEAALAYVNPSVGDQERLKYEEQRRLKKFI